MYDYGYDLVLCTYDYQGDTEFTNGEVENGEVFLQLKATDKLTLRKDGQTISFPIERRHIELWRGEVMPVILILYEVESDTAYWLYVQSYCNEPAFRMPLIEQKEVSLFVPKKNMLNEEAMRQFRQYKEEVLHQVRTNVKNIHRREEGRE